MRAGNTKQGSEEEQRRAGEVEEEEVRLSHREQRGYPAEAVKQKSERKGQR